ncbi:MAG: hypothetical protein ACK4XJ_10335 [Fimbriimonadaceae bacterium]
MRRGLERLLVHAIDYAGLFPPARLDMPAAITQYAELYDAPDTWIVDRFVCPVGRLNQLAENMSLWPNDDPLPLTVIGTAGADVASVDAELATIGAFESAQDDRVVVAAYEVKPNDLGPVAERLSRVDDWETFIEVDWTADVAEQVFRVAEFDGVGVKARTGGVTAEAFPSAELLATFIREAVSLETPFKFTAGLHHALPHHDGLIGARHHGFLNVFTAAVMADSHGLSSQILADILNETRSDAFRFTDEGMNWDGLEATLAEIDDARSLAVGWGSCSVAEPLADLRALGLWEVLR